MRRPTPVLTKAEPRKVQPRKRSTAHGQHPYRQEKEWNYGANHQPFTQRLCPEGLPLQKSTAHGHPSTQEKKERNREKTYLPCLQKALPRRVKPRQESGTHGHHPSRQEKEWNRGVTEPPILQRHQPKGLSHGRSQQPMAITFPNRRRRGTVGQRNHHSCESIIPKGKATAEGRG